MIRVSLASPFGQTPYLRSTVCFVQPMGALLISFFDNFPSKVPKGYTCNSLVNSTTLFYNMFAVFVAKVSASARSTVVVTRGADRGSGLRAVTEVYQWGHGSDMPSRVNFNSNGDVSSSSKSSSKSPSRLSSRWRTHDDRVDITDVSAAKNHNLALSSVGQVYTWGFGADNLGTEGV